MLRFPFGFAASCAFNVLTKAVLALEVAGLADDKIGLRITRRARRPFDFALGVLVWDRNDDLGKIERRAALAVEQGARPIVTFSRRGHEQCVRRRTGVDLGDGSQKALFRSRSAARRQHRSRKRHPQTGAPTGIGPRCGA
ncbi:hypothetical protein [Bosea thiooxidans]